nr:hypothetical protein [Rhodospirillum rubrum]
MRSLRPCRRSPAVGLSRRLRCAPRRSAVLETLDISVFLGPWIIPVGAVLGGLFGYGIARLWRGRHPAEAVAARDLLAPAAPPPAVEPVEAAAPVVEPIEPAPPAPVAPPVPTAPKLVEPVLGVAEALARGPAEGEGAAPGLWLDHADGLAAEAHHPAAIAALARALDGLDALLDGGGDDPAIDAALTRAATLAATLGDRPGLARSRALGGRLREIQGDPEAAHGAYLAALDLYEGMDDHDGVVATCDLLAMIHARADDPEGAEAYWRYGLTLVTETGNRVEEARLLGRLGAVALYREDWQGAEDVLGEALALEERLGNLAAAGAISADLGRLEEGRERPNEALAHWRRATSLLIEAGESEGELARTCAEAVLRLLPAVPPKKR